MVSGEERSWILGDGKAVLYRHFGPAFKGDFCFVRVVFAMSRLSVCLPGCVEGPHSQGRIQFHIAAKHPDGRLGELDDMPKKTLQHALHTPDGGTSMLLRIP